MPPTLSLPLYPSPQELRALPPSTRATLHHDIALAVSALPVNANTPSTVLDFIESYASHTASSALSSACFPSYDEDLNGNTKDERTIRTRVYALACSLARSHSRDFAPHTILDLLITYPSPSRARGLVEAFGADAIFTADAFPPSAFTALLSTSFSADGSAKARARTLETLAKTVQTLLALLRPSPRTLRTAYAHDLGLLRALGRAYSACVTPSSSSAGPADVVEGLALRTRTMLLDVFHILFGTLLVDLRGAAGVELARESEHTFGLIFELLDSPGSSLLADYQHFYNLASALSATPLASDPRLDLLEAQLASLDDGGTERLHVLLRGSGAAAKDKGKARAADPPTNTPNSSSQSAERPETEQVLAILPHLRRAYVQTLLRTYGADGRDGDALVEAVVGAVLEGRAEADDETDEHGGGQATEEEEWAYTKERRNIWDEVGEQVAVKRVDRIGVDGATTLDSTEADALKADILRRAAAIDEEDDEADEDGREGRGRTLAYFSEEEDVQGPGVRVEDGSDESDDSEDDDEETEEPVESYLLTLYASSPQLFARDAQTRRGKERKEMHERTKWDDGQIEGWAVMLERNPKKEKILADHAFATSRNTNHSVPVPASSRGRGRGGRGGGRGRGGGEGSARGGGGGGGRGGGSGGGDARERAWKDKNKASRGNHGRKRGHDKKMARAGGPG